MSCTRSKMKNPPSLLAMVLVFILQSYVPAYADCSTTNPPTCSYVTNGQSIPISPSAFQSPVPACQEVTDNCPLPIMVPTGSQNEWTSFVSNHESCAALSVCPPLNCTQQTIQWRDASSGMTCSGIASPENINAQETVYATSVGHMDGSTTATCNANNTYSLSLASCNCQTGYTLVNGICTQSGGGGGTASTNNVAYNVHNHAWPTIPSCDPNCAMQTEGHFYVLQQPFYDFVKADPAYANSDYPDAVWRLTAPYGFNSWPGGFQEIANDIITADTSFGVNPASDPGLSSVFASIECGIVLKNPGGFVNSSAYLAVCQSAPGYIDAIAQAQLNFNEVPNETSNTTTVSGTNLGAAWKVTYTGWRTYQTEFQGNWYNNVFAVTVDIDQSANSGYYKPLCVSTNLGPFAKPGLCGIRLITCTSPQPNIANNGYCRMIQTDISNHTGTCEEVVPYLDECQGTTWEPTSVMGFIDNLPSIPQCGINCGQL